jgi:hypothetical protein
MTGNKILNLNLSPEELNLILLALGQLPYNQVSELIHHIQCEAGPQLVAAKKAAESKLKQVGND